MRREKICLTLKKKKTLKKCLRNSKEETSIIIQRIFSNQSLYNGWKYQGKKKNQAFHFRDCLLSSSK